MGLLNIGSLFFGIMALVLPIVSIVKRDRYGFKRKRLYTFSSLVYCIISVYFQFLYNNYLVKIEDITALMDTTETSVVLSGILIFIVVILNFICLKVDDN